MKKILNVLFISLLLVSSCVLAIDVETYNNEKFTKFGLKEKNSENIITEAKYNKLIKLGNTSYLFLYKNKYGIISKTGEILVEPKYTQAQRYAQRYVKLGNRGLYGLFDEHGKAIIDVEYSSIDILYGKMFLVQKNYKYGLISYEGDIILAPVADDIYMPKANVLKMQYDGNWIEIEQKDGREFQLPHTIAGMDASADSFKVTQLVQQPITTTGYGIISASDYFIKLFSSISPAYEQTIDELILNHGADTATILIKSSWLLKFPFVYGKNYFNNLKAPNNGPLSDVKADLKNKLKEKDRNL